MERTSVIRLTHDQGRRPIDVLATFVRVAERGGLSAAARDLGQSQPYVSRQLAELEARLGERFIRRTTHSMSLTAAGLELLAEVRRLLGDWDGLEERRRPAGGVRGGLRIVAPIALGQRRLGDAAMRFQARRPDVTLSWKLDDQAVRFSEEGCDCWIKIGAVPDETLVVRTLGHVERMVAGAPPLAQALAKDPLPSALSALPWVALDAFEGGQIKLHDETGKESLVARRRRGAAKDGRPADPGRRSAPPSAGRAPRSASWTS